MKTIFAIIYTLLCNLFLYPFYCVFQLFYFFTTRGSQPTRLDGISVYNSSIDEYNKFAELTIRGLNLIKDNDSEAFQIVSKYIHKIIPSYGGLYLYNPLFNTFYIKEILIKESIKLYASYFVGKAYFAERYLDSFFKKVQYHKAAQQGRAYELECSKRFLEKIGTEKHLIEYLSEKIYYTKHIDTRKIQRAYYRDKLSKARKEKK